MNFLKKKIINLFGSTGSVGRQTLDIVNKFPDNFEINILCGGDNYELLASQVIKFNPKIIIAKDNVVEKLKLFLPENKNIYKISELENIFKECGEFDLNIMAINGFQALNYSYIIAKYSYGKPIAMANKEAMICGGDIFLKFLHLQNILLIPLDSEHNGAFQLLNKLSVEEKKNIDKLIITASGGPFLNYSKKDLKNVTFADAVKHPRWNMGAKISVDSATLMNKALELIEAHYLFKLKVDAIIHPQSVVHAILQKKSDEYIQYASMPDMRNHIAYSMFYPNESLWSGEKLNFNNFTMNFYEIDYDRFPLVKIAHDIINSAPHLAIAFNAASEIAFDLFARGVIKFIDIDDYIKSIVEENSNMEIPSSIEDIMKIDREVHSRYHQLCLM